MLKILKALYLFLNVIIIAALITIHFVIKDRNYDASLLFYAFPLPVIIIIVLALSIFLNKKFRTINLIVTLLLFIVWLGRSFKINFPEDIKETDLEIVFWNASHDRDFEDAFSENNGIPDVLVLVEYHGDFLKETKLNYPDYYFYKHYSKEIGIFSKTPIQIIEDIPSKFSTTILNFETNDINFYTVDVVGSMDVPREWGLKSIDKAITKWKNTVLLGDFNVPYESLLLEKTKNKFNHTFNEKGNGFRETWFWNIPLLSLDHIWVSKDLEIIKSKKVNTFKSDHAMIKTFIRK
tara:strand:- start:159 stop:1037 length:879 start_codon:yes stop_codon:yes gene_type:complete